MIPLDPTITWTLRLALAVLFASAAWHKLRAPREFAAAVQAYQLVPERGALPVAASLMASEAAATVLLFAPAWYRPGALLAAALLALYAGAIAVNLLRGRRDLDCGCAGPGGRRPVSGTLVARNVVVLGGALLLLGPGSERATTWVDMATVLAATVTLAALWAGVMGLDANRPALARIRGMA